MSKNSQTTEFVFMHTHNKILDLNELRQIKIKENLKAAEFKFFLILNSLQALSKIFMYNVNNSDVSKTWTCNILLWVTFKL